MGKKDIIPMPTMFIIHMNQIKETLTSEIPNIKTQLIGENKKIMQWIGDYSILVINNKIGLNADGIHKILLFERN